MVAEAGSLPQSAAPYAVGLIGGPSVDLERCLESEGVVFFPADGGALVRTDADALLLDLTEVDQRGLDRASGQAPHDGAPVIAAIAWDLLRWRELKVQADDVIVVPWRLGELRLRISRLLERKTPPVKPGVINAGDLVIDPERYDVYLAGRPVLLTFKEYELLKFLATNPGRVYSRESLLEQVWGYHYFGGTRTVDVHIRRLRSKIEDADHVFIDTVWNVGYRFHG